MTELNKRAKRISNVALAAAVAAMLAAPAISPRLAHADSPTTSNAVAVDKAKGDQPPPPPDDPAASSLINSQPLAVLPPVEPVRGFTPSPKSTIKIGQTTYAADQILVKFKSSASEDKVKEVMSKHNLGKLSHAKAIGWRTLSVPDGVDVQALVQQLNSEPDVELAELNGIGTVSGTPVDPAFRGSTGGYYDGQYNLKRIGMEAAWYWTKGAGDITIAVLDSGIKSNHEDLNSKIARDAQGNLLGFNVRQSGYPEDDTYSDAFRGHGTAVAGIAAAQTGFAPAYSPGIAGVNPYSTILPVKVTDSNGQWSNGNLRDGIIDAISNPNVKVINISLQYNVSDSGVLAAIKQANDRGVLVVASAGNSLNPNDVFFPAAYWRAMSVAGTNLRDDRAIDSVIGYQNSVAAPGGETTSGLILSTSNTGGYSFYNGTSFAAPQVSGLAALALSEYPTMTWSDLRYRIEDTADGNLIADDSFEGQPGQPGQYNPVSPPWTTEVGPNGTINGTGVDLGQGVALAEANNAYILKVTPDNNWNAIKQAGVPVQPFTNYRLGGWIQNSNNISDGYFGVRNSNESAILQETRFFGLPVYTNLNVDFNTGGNSTVTPYAGYWAVSSMGGLSWMRLDGVSLTPLRGYDPQFGWGRINAAGAVRPDYPPTVGFPQDNNSRMVSLPVWPGNWVLDRLDRSQDIARLFPGSTGVAYWYSPKDVQYLPYTDARVPRVGVGRGYWVRLANGSSNLSYGGAVAFHKPGHPAVVELGPGYNTIGAPAVQPIQWNPYGIQVRYQDSNGLAVVKTLADAKAAGWVDDFTVHWNTATQQYDRVSSSPSDPLHQLVPGEGYFFRAYVDCELLLPNS